MVGLKEELLLENRREFTGVVDDKPPEGRSQHARANLGAAHRGLDERRLHAREE